MAQARNIESGLVDRVRDPEREHTAQGRCCSRSRAPSRPGSRTAAKAWPISIWPASARHVRGTAPGNAAGIEAPADTLLPPGADNDEHSLGQSIMRDMDAAGLPGRVGIAGSKLAARAAAALPRSPNVVAPRGEARFLAPLPLKSLFKWQQPRPRPRRRTETTRRSSTR